jgi:5S rRNA maturation endonuclease (ribonuclease M5)
MINKICSTEDFEQFLLSIGLRDCGKRISGTCPVHKGNNTTAFTYYKQSSKWICFTRGCEAAYEYGIPGLLKALGVDCDLSKFEFEYTPPPPITKRPPPFEPVCDLTHFHMLYYGDGIFPSAYFQKRGYSKQVLERFNVGDCHKKGIKCDMAQRAVAPLFNTGDLRNVVAYTGRNISRQKRVKWFHSRFQKTHTFYNLWNFETLTDCQTAIIVEGPGDIWRLVEAGYEQGLALLGKGFSKMQQFILKDLGIKKVVLALDNDDAGQAGQAEIKKHLDFCEVLFTDLPNKKDVGDLSIDQVHHLIGSLL